MTGSHDTRIILSTAPPGDASGLARDLVERRLAACVNIVPGVSSVYRWEGKVESEIEALLIIKCVEDRVEALLSKLVDLHPYEVPEALVLPLQGGAEDYMAWVRDSCAPDEAS